MPYCQFCGTFLEEGQTCACTMTQVPPIQPSQNSQVTGQQMFNQTMPNIQNQVMMLLNDVKAYLKDYVANPVMTVQSELNTNSMRLPVFWLLIKMLAMGLVIYGLLKKICDSSVSIISNSLMYYDWEFDVSIPEITVSVMPCLLYGALIAAVGTLLFVVMAFALVKMQHGTITMMQVLKVNASNGILSSALLMIAFLLSFVSIKFCLAFMVLSVLAWIISGVLTIFVVSPNGRSGVLWLMYLVGVVIVIVMGFYTMPSLFFKAVEAVSITFNGRTFTLHSIISSGSMYLNSMLAESGASNFQEYLAYAVEEMFTWGISEIWDYIAYSF